MFLDSFVGTEECWVKLDFKIIKERLWKQIDNIVDQSLLIGKQYLKKYELTKLLFESWISDYTSIVSI